MNCVFPKIRFDFEEDGVILFANKINFFPKLITYYLITRPLITGFGM